MPIQAQFSQMRPVAVSHSVGPRFPLYPPGAPGLGQPFLYGQHFPAIPPQVSNLEKASSLDVDICNCILFFPHLLMLGPFYEILSDSKCY